MPSPLNPVLESPTQKAAGAAMIQTAAESASGIAVRKKWG
jgi:hypothetical protein